MTDAIKNDPEVLVEVDTKCGSCGVPKKLSILIPERVNKTSTDWPCSFCGARNVSIATRHAGRQIETIDKNTDGRFSVSSPNE